MKKLFKIIFNEKLIYIILLLCIYASFIYSLEYLLLKQVIENFTIKAIVFLLLIAASRSLAKYLRLYFTIKVQNNLRINQSKKLFDKIINLDYNYFLEISSGDLVNVLTSQINVICVNGVFCVLQVFEAIFSLIFLSCSIFVLSKEAFIITSIVFIVFTFMVIKANEKIKIICDKVYEINNKITSTINSSILTFENIKIFNKQKSQKDIYINYVKECNKYKLKEENIDNVINILCNISYYAIVFIMLFINLKLKLSIATLFTIIMLMDDIYNPIFYILNSNFQFQNIFMTLKKIEDIEKLQNKVLSGNTKINNFKILQIKNLCFNYKEKDTIQNSIEDFAIKDYVLKNINLTIHKGERIGICGKSGNGKSSLIKLIMRFYDFQKGDILINNISIKDIDINNLYNVISLVPQNINLFNGSIYDNLVFAKDASLDEVIDICKKVNIHNFINSLPDKYNTIIGERGLKLSNGQQQRILIARVLLKNPDVIIFDEATASLDNENERIIQEIVNNIKDKTIITIAHRLSTIKNCDRIIVIDDNTIKEIGTYNELMQKKGTFYKLNGD